MIRSLFALHLFAVSSVVLFPAICCAQEEGRDDAELTVAVAKTALKGWELFQAGDFAAAFNGGHYTDPDPNTQVRDFWSSGRWAMLDRNGDGRHETIFLVENKELVYVGCLDARGTLVNPASRFKPHLGKTRDAVIRSLRLE
jgi:hypothetical protein